MIVARARIAKWLAWFALLAGVALAMLAVRSRVDKAHVSLAFSARCARGAAPRRAARSASRWPRWRFSFSTGRFFRRTTRSSPFFCTLPKETAGDDVAGVWSVDPMLGGGGTFALRRSVRAVQPSLPPRD